MKALLLVAVNYRIDLDSEVAEDNFPLIIESANYERRHGIDLEWNSCWYFVLAAVEHFEECLLNSHALLMGIVH